MKHPSAALQVKAHAIFDHVHYLRRNHPVTSTPEHEFLSVRRAMDAQVKQALDMVTTEWIMTGGENKEVDAWRTGFNALYNRAYLKGGLPWSPLRVLPLDDLEKLLFPKRFTTQEEPKPSDVVPVGEPISPPGVAGADFVGIDPRCAQRVELPEGSPPKFLLVPVHEEIGVSVANTNGVTRISFPEDPAIPRVEAVADPMSAAEFERLTSATSADDAVRGQASAALVVDDDQCFDNTPPPVEASAEDTKVSDENAESLEILKNAAGVEEVPVAPSSPETAVITSWVGGDLKKVAPAEASE